MSGLGPLTISEAPTTSTPPTAFETLTNNVGKFDLTRKKALIPDMSGAGSQLLGATLRGFGIDAVVMDTYKGLNLGKQFTSGKECFPCQVTLGDFLHHMELERERLGDAFDPESYIYCLAEADGPCRFGMYTKLHRIVIDSLDGFQNMPITYITCADNYSADGLIEPESQPALVRNAVYAFLVSDVLNRILWRTRPYEKQPGQADAVFEEGLSNLIRLFELHGRQAEGGPVLDELERIATAAEAVVDPGIPPKPLIGMVGEIYLRSHCESNNDLIRLLERHGAEVVNASITEWIHFVIYDLMQKAGRETAHAVRRRNFRAACKHAREWARQRITLTYQELRMSQVYRRVSRHLPIHADHRIAHIERRLDDDRVFSFRMGTEAALSIGGALEYAAHGCDGIVNVFPFGCMPSTTCSAVLRPILDRLHVPYIDSSYDGTDQPNREAIVRTFMYQAAQHGKSSTSR